MGKRFADTDKYKKPFMRHLPGAYKLLWDYICLDCNSAGIWQVDFEVAQIYLGRDMPVSRELALGYFNTGEERIMVLNGGSKWLVIPFIPFQYGVLREDCKPHLAVFRILAENGLKGYPKGIHTLVEKDKDKDKDMDKEKKKDLYSPEFMRFWATYPNKVGKDCAWKSWQTKKPNVDKCLLTLSWQIPSTKWTESEGKFIPMPATWINQGRWNDVPDTHNLIICPDCGAEGYLPKTFRGKPICGSCKQKGSIL